MGVSQDTDRAEVRTFDNALYENRSVVRRALADVRATATASGTVSESFVAPYRLPEDSPALRYYFAASALSVRDLGPVGPLRARLLDLMGNPRTRTTKTFASLVIVARAIAHVHETGESVMIVTPSSGNKATALRDAVLRAYEANLATPDQLSITVLVPRASRDKLWASPLSQRPELRAANPVVVSDHPTATVKEIAREVVDSIGERHYRDTGWRLWYTLDLGNYMAADAVRAVISEAVREPGSSVTHLHSVSSAYGLLGHHFGAGLLGVDPVDRYFLVQHLGTPDMVLDLVFDSFDRDNIPRFEFDEQQGLYRQRSCPNFPYEASDLGELLEPTFYTSRPPTSPRMKQIIRSQGGGGIVVSLHECLARYAATRAVLRRAGITLPADPRQVREWSLVMAWTGAELAVERQLITAETGAGSGAGSEILVHGSGCYSQADYLPLAADHVWSVSSVREFGEVLRRASVRAGREGALV